LALVAYSEITLRCSQKNLLLAALQAGSHGKCFPVRELFLGAISHGQSYIINLHGVCRYRCLVQRKIVITRPPPILGPLHPSIFHWIQMHALQALKGLQARTIAAPIDRGFRIKGKAHGQESTVRGYQLFVSATVYQLG
jgi:hypothetical protein